MLHRLMFFLQFFLNIKFFHLFVLWHYDGYFGQFSLMERSSGDWRGRDLLKCKEKNEEVKKEEDWEGEKGKGKDE